MCPLYSARVVNGCQEISSADNFFTNELNRSTSEKYRAKPTAISMSPIQGITRKNLQPRELRSLHRFLDDTSMNRGANVNELLCTSWNSNPPDPWSWHDFRRPGVRITTQVSNATAF